MFLQLLQTAAESAALEKDKGKYIFFHTVLKFVYQLKTLWKEIPQNNKLTKAEADKILV